MLRCFLSWGRFSSSLRGQLKTNEKVRLKHNMLIVFHWLQIQHMLFITWATLKRILAMLVWLCSHFCSSRCTDYHRSPASEPSWKWKKGVREGWGEIEHVILLYRIFLSQAVEPPIACSCFHTAKSGCYNPADFNQAVSMGLDDELVVAHFHFLDHLWKEYSLETLGLIHFHLVSTFTFNMDWRKQLSSWQCCSWLDHPRTCKRLITMVIVFVP